MKNLFCLLLLLVAARSRADVYLPAILSSDMVLQQQTDITLWGWANPTEQITITAGWDNKPVSTTCAENATWRVTLHTPAAGGPYKITIKGYNTIVLANVLVGEVWLCSGQSNMEMSGYGAKDARAELPSAYNPAIRFIKIPKTAADYPQSTMRGSWAVCDSNSLKNVSAVGFFFGRKLQQTLNVPVGLIDASWGGSYMESWVPESLVMLYPDLKRSAQAIGKAPWSPNKAGVLYNGMIAPLTQFPIAGVIWYQGESNRHDPRAYYHLTHVMVDSWRGLWQKEFPFYSVQIAPYTYNGKYETAAVREAQVRATDLPKSGIVITTDLVDNIRDIHPAYKKEVGLRLANYALAETYGKAVGAYKSPQYKSMQVTGNVVRVVFDNAPDGFIVKGTDITEFEIAGPDKVFTKAQARVKGNTIEVSSPAVSNPVAVRFAFRDAPEPNLFSKGGLPVIPFRTDDGEL